MGYIKLDVEDLVGSYPVCSQCGARNVVRDVWANWSNATHEWVLKALFDEYACDKCGESNTPVWKLDKGFRKKRICRLNDEMRIGNFKNGSLVMTVGTQSLSDEWRAAIVDQISRFDSFSEDNDPHGEHGFGSLEVAGNKIFWKIDYFDLKLKCHSPDAANPDVTHRVLTIMLASEY